MPDRIRIRNRGYNSVVVLSEEGIRMANNIGRTLGHTYGLGPEDTELLIAHILDREELRHRCNYLCGYDRFVDELVYTPGETLCMGCISADSPERVVTIEDFIRLNYKLV